MESSKNGDCRASARVVGSLWSDKEEGFEPFFPDAFGGREEERQGAEDMVIMRGNLGRSGIRYVTPPPMDTLRRGS